jgi:Spy/CpxP family protein refolding chaperone
MTAKTLTLATILLLSTIISIPAFGAISRQEPGDRPIKKLAQVLGLSELQQKQVRDIFKRNEPQTLPLHKQLVIERRALRSLVQSDTFDEQAIRRQSGVVALVEADIAVLRGKLNKEIRALLTAPQLEKFKSIQNERDLKRDQFLDRADNHLEAD